MGRKKNSNFKLSPDWVLKEPIDFEYNKYKLLDYLKKCEDGFNNLEVYPNFVEIALHLANLQSISKDKKLLTTNKKFKSCDDEILIKEIKSKEIKSYTEPELDELKKTIEYSGVKLFDAFNVAKSIWTLAFDNITIILRRNKEKLSSGYGYCFFLSKENILFVWEYSNDDILSHIENNNMSINLIYSESYIENEVTLKDIIKSNSKLEVDIDKEELPIFEVKCGHNFPFEQTFVPMIKRKILSYILQTVTLESPVQIDNDEKNNDN